MRKLALVLLAAALLAACGDDCPPEEHQECVVTGFVPIPIYNGKTTTVVVTPLRDCYCEANQ